MKNYFERELKKDCPVPFLHNCNPFAKYASCVTSLTVKSAKSLINLESSGNFYKILQNYFFQLIFIFK